MEYWRLEGSVSVAYQHAHRPILQMLKTGPPVRHQHVRLAVSVCVGHCDRGRHFAARVVHDSAAESSVALPQQDADRIVTPISDQNIELPVSVYVCCRYPRDNTARVITDCRLERAVAAADQDSHCAAPLSKSGPGEVVSYDEVRLAVSIDVANRQR